jgi:Ribbon-helix-helix protein, copG family
VAWCIILANEVETGRAVNKQRRQPKKANRLRGRPPKEKSEATLTRRLQILLSSDDLARIAAIMETTNAASMGEAIREAIRRDFQRLKKRGGQISE